MGDHRPSDYIFILYMFQMWVVENLCPGWLSILFVLVHVSAQDEYQQK